MKQAYAYIRVSSKEQEQEGYSIPAQVKFLNNYAEQNNIQIVKQFIDVETAKATGRKQFEAMLEGIKSNGIKTIICEKVDRLYRNLKDWVTLDELGVTLVFAKEGIVGQESSSDVKFMHGIRVLMAKKYIDNLSEEVKKGMLEKAEQGEWPHLAPPGYLNNDGKIFTDPDRAQYIRRAFELAGKGYSITHIAEKLYSAGLRSKAGNKVARSKIHAALTNPIYYGYYNYKGVIYKGIHEPLIDKDLFDSVQKRLKSKGHQETKKHVFTFRGLLTCGECGCKITAERQKGHVYYRCTKSKGKCSQPYIREEQLTLEIAELLKNIQLSDWKLSIMKKAVKESMADQQAFYFEAQKKLEARHRRVESRISKLMNSFLDGDVPAELYKQKLNELRCEKADIEEARALNNQTHEGRFEPVEKIGILANSWGNGYADLKDATKRELLEFISSNLYIKDKKIHSYQLKEPFNFLLKDSFSPGGRPGGIRTPNIRFWRPALYQLELLAFFQLIAVKHFFQTKLCLRCRWTESNRHGQSPRVFETRVSTNSTTSALPTYFIIAKFFMKHI